MSVRDLHPVALADFAGVCSGDIYVLEPSSDALIPELLPFICQTDAFFEHAITTSAGSLSPRTNWSSLAKFEFPLPPIGEQRRIVKVLEAARRSSDAMVELVSAAEVLSRALAVRTFSPSEAHAIRPRDWKPSSWGVATLASLIESDAPVVYGIVQVGNFDAKGVPTLAINSLDGDFSTRVHRTSKSIESKYQRSRVKSGDVLISIEGTIGEIAIVPRHFRGNISRHLARLRFATNRIDPRYFLHLYQSPAFKRYTASLVVGTTRAELSIDTIRKMEVPLPTLDLQCGIADEMDQANLSVASSRKRLIEGKGNDETSSGKLPSCRG